MATDVAGGNWYRVWSIGNSVIVTDDDKVKGPARIECLSPNEADVRARRTAFELALGRKPLWDILGVEKESLTEDIFQYEQKRIKWFGIVS